MKEKLKKYSRYELALFIIGIIAIFVGLTSLFTPLGDKTPPPSIGGEGFLAVTDPQFEGVIEGIVNNSFKDGGDVAILTNADTFLPDLIKEIDAASSSIHITNYIWDEGEFGAAIFEALIRKSEQGVEVRILLDGLGGRKAQEEYRQRLTNAGGKIGIFRDVTFGQLTRIHRRTHVRAFIIDNDVAYTGGVAIADSWLGSATSSDSWHDFMFKLEGSMAEETQKVFSSMWHQTTGEVINSSAFSPDEDGSARFISIFTSPAPDMNSSMEHFLWYSIGSARESIRIENPYLVLSEPLLEMMKKKAEEGVKIEIILPGKHTDQKVVQWTSKSYYKQLIESGVSIYEYGPSRLHSKFIIIDDSWSIIGSANLDNRSRELNVESLLGIVDPGFAAALGQSFEADKAKSILIDVKDWKKRAILIQVLGTLGRFFIKQY